MAQACKQPAQTEDKVKQWVQSYKDAPLEKRAATIDAIVNDILAFSSDRTKTIVKDQLKDFLIEGGSKFHVNLNRGNANNVAAFVNGVLGSKLAEVKSAAEFCDVYAVKDESKAAKEPLRVLGGQTTIEVNAPLEKAAQQKTSIVPKPIVEQRAPKKSSTEKGELPVETLVGRVSVRTATEAEKFLDKLDKFMAENRNQGTTIEVSVAGKKKEAYFSGPSKTEFQQRSATAHQQTISFLQTNNWVFDFLGKDADIFVEALYVHFCDLKLSLGAFKKTVDFISANRSAIELASKGIMESRDNLKGNPKQQLSRFFTDASDGMIKLSVLSIAMNRPIFGIDTKLQSALTMYESTMRNKDVGIDNISVGPGQINQRSFAGQRFQPTSQAVEAVFEPGVSVLKPVLNVGGVNSMIRSNPCYNIFMGGFTLACMSVFISQPARRDPSVDPGVLKGKRISELHTKDELTALAHVYNPGSNPNNYAKVIVEARDNARFYYKVPGKAAEEIEVPWLKAFPKFVD